MLNMRNRYFFSFLLLSFMLLLDATAQTDPGTDNLMHQWTFDDGTATDIVGSADGTLQGAATITNKALNTSDGGYLSFPGSIIGVDSYSALTTEVWFRSSEGANDGNTMLSYFGDTDVGGSYGANYLYTSPSNGGNCRLAISVGNTSEPWSVEDGVNRPEGAIDDGALHHLVSVIDDSSITLYVDGEEVGSEALTGSNALSGVSSENVFLGKSGYSNDPIWRGAINQFSIYNKALTADEIPFLFDAGAESSTSIDASVTSLAFDELDTSASFKVTGSKLSDSIRISAPAGLNVSPEVLDSIAVDQTVEVTYDGTSVIDDNLTLNSGDVEMTIPVKAESNESCYTPLYSEIPNLIANPLMDTIVGSWGNADVVSGTDVYCGSKSVKISGTGSCYPDGGSINSEEIDWLPHVTYRFHAKVKTMDGSFNMGVQNANVNGGSGDHNITIPHTNGEWADFDATFTTGGRASSGVAFFNNCGGASGMVAYIDNWELYALPGISSSTKSIYLDEFVNSASFEVTGVNLDEPIQVESSDGISVDQRSLPADAVGETLTVTSDGTDPLEGTITLTSDSSTQTVSVTVDNNEECFTPLYPDSVNLISDPFLSDLNNFSATGASAVNTNPDYSFCGISSGEISDNGTISKELTGVMKPNTQYRVKAKVYRKNPGNVTYTLDMDSASNPTKYELIKTAMDSACWYFNKYTPFSEDIYVYYSDGIPTAQASHRGSIGFGSNTRYMWVGTAIHEMAHYFGSGTTSTWQSKIVDGKWTGTAGNNMAKSIDGGTISGDSQHYWPHGINQKEEITNLGGKDAQHEGLVNAVKVINAMLVDDCGFAENKAPVGVGVSGWSSDGEDIYHEVTSTTEWQDVDFTFTTDSSLASTQNVYFEAGPGYIDNWEMYELGPATGIEAAQISDATVFADDNQVVSKFELSRESDVAITIYDVQGRQLIEKRAQFMPGSHSERINVNLPDGIYIVELVSDEFVVSKKIIW